METMSNLGTGARSELTAYQLQAYVYIPYSYNTIIYNHEYINWVFKLLKIVAT